MIPNVHKGIANVKFDHPLIFDMLCYEVIFLKYYKDWLCLC